MDGFPNDKHRGVPCRHLTNDFLCEIHEVLSQKGCRGCVAYDCFSAGQFVTQKLYRGENWTSPEKSTRMLGVFLVVYRLRQILWHLLEASVLTEVPALYRQIESLIDQTGRFSLGSRKRSCMRTLRNTGNV